MPDALLLLRLGAGFVLGLYAVFLLDAALVLDTVLVPGAGIVRDAVRVLVLDTRLVPR